MVACHQRQACDALQVLALDPGLVKGRIGQVVADEGRARAGDRGNLGGVRGHVHGLTRAALDPGREPGAGGESQQVRLWLVDPGARQRGVEVIHENIGQRGQDELGIEPGPQLSRGGGDGAQVAQDRQVAFQLHALVQVPQHPEHQPAAGLVSDLGKIQLDVALGPVESSRRQPDGHAEQAADAGGGISSEADVVGLVQSLWLDRMQRLADERLRRPPEQRMDRCVRVHDARFHVGDEHRIGHCVEDLVEIKLVHEGGA